MFYINFQYERNWAGKYHRYVGMNPDKHRADSCIPVWLTTISPLLQLQGCMVSKTLHDKDRELVRIWKAVVTHFKVLLRTETRENYEKSQPRWRRVKKLVFEPGSFRMHVWGYVFQEILISKLCIPCPQDNVALNNMWQVMCTVEEKCRGLFYVFINRLKGLKKPTDTSVSLFLGNANQKSHTALRCTLGSDEKKQALFWDSLRDPSANDWTLSEMEHSV
jgi:hypothetical protein